ncbi:LPXTG cell wall anchor domain-containing protein [Bifidobacterium tissieri]|uniref:LPXTG cell wall anchor domain-containing protein n=1 Tax=Bifidobacterium tissieri TaxID=1630162 RepID=UPI001239018A|nr:LPXTG cell wall anchor domain-containing protein [Bifidobacterium tissieri]KAA8830173.1 hypothetical protein EM849_10365 [Bifidobacterium tissieri]
MMMARMVVGLLAVLLAAETPMAVGMEPVSSDVMANHVGVMTADGSPTAPVPGKAWASQDEDGTWRMRPDGGYLLNGDDIAGVVMVTMPADKYREDANGLTITDDWSRLDRYLDLGDEAVRVVMTRMGEEPDRVVDGTVTGDDVTGGFDVTVEGTMVRASMGSELAERIREGTGMVRLAMLVPFTVRFDLSADLARTPAQDPRGMGLNTCADDGGVLANMGRVDWYGTVVSTNEPTLCIIRPQAVKTVTSNSADGGDGSDVNGRTILPGQRLTYRSTMTIDPASGYPVGKLEFTDTYDSHVTADQKSLSVTDGGITVPAAAYDQKWDDAQHQLHVTFKADWLRANWDSSRQHQIMVSFDVVADEETPADTVLTSGGNIVMNNAVMTLGDVTNQTVEPIPAKQSAQADSTTNVDGRTVILGERFHYLIDIDADRLTNSAYPVYRMGIVDDYDDDHLTLDREGIRMTDSDGNDATDLFSIQVTDGVVYVFLTPADGQLPSNLSEYAKQDVTPGDSIGIDPKLLAVDYRLVLPMTVTTVNDGGTVTNTVTQITNNRRAESNTTANMLADINPDEDVTIGVGEESANGMSVYAKQPFLYRLDSSVLPADRAYPAVSEWRIDDDFDESGDQYTGQWAVYTVEDLLDADGTVIAAKGTRIAGSGFDSTTVGGDLFALDMLDGAFTVMATPRYLDLVSADTAHPHGWRAYVQFTRIRTGEVANTFTETINGTQRQANTVTTATPEWSPSISVTMFDTAGGPKDGDRNESKDALQLTREDTPVVFRITNTGDRPLTGLDLSVETVAGDGMIADIDYPNDWNSLVLEPGKSVDVTGVVRGVTERHTSRATAKGSPIVECVPDGENPFDGAISKPRTGDVCTDTPVKSAPDDWNAYALSRLSNTGVHPAGIVAAIMLSIVTGVVLLQRFRRTS